MTDTPIFDSRDPRCKTPYGAVASGVPVRLTLRPWRGDGWSRAFVKARFEFRNDETVTLPMPWAGLDGDRDLFSCELDTAGYLGLVWYSFRLERLDGKCLELPERQLTVYDGTVEVPTWFGEGVTYQIFPDRFRRTSVPDPTGMVGGRSVHTGWFEEPVWRPDERGEVRNRDFFGGSLTGVMEKLDYLQSLGVETIYFCPIFEGPENHRYGTGDYEKVDPMLGTNEDFSLLCAAARAKGMRVMLDGVFNHQGFVSRYFNGDGSYPGLGAHQSKESPYYSWYHFSHWPDRYDSWWGIYSLPAVNESEPGYVDYIIENENSIVRRWLEAGADGWRLDVADELPDEFVGKLHAAARAVKPDAVIIGEVWEDGSNKVAYGVRRKHLLGGYLDGLMNYPFRNALLTWLLSHNAGAFRETMETLRENYPPAAFYSAMNSLGTHDTPRILTLLGVGGDCGGESKEWRSTYRLTPEQRKLGMERLRLASLVQYAFPGSPTTYYGDEAGMEGFEDPFNRRTFPWGSEDQDLTAWYTALGKARKELAPLRKGDIAYVKAEGAVLAFTRTWEGDSVLCAANAGDRPTTLTVDGSWAQVGGSMVWSADAETGQAAIRLAPMSGLLLRRL
ncbi:glycoside hydrolase family 13 protein [Intestinimonas aquisgranensis]|nr:glycoside hydrolase family 13 protein [Intestinimonas aquisgranensis]